MLLKYLKSLGSACIVTGVHCLGVDLAFHLLVTSFSRELFGRSENFMDQNVWWMFTLGYS